MGLRDFCRYISKRGGTVSTASKGERKGCGGAVVWFGIVTRENRCEGSPADWIVANWQRDRMTIKERDSVRELSCPRIILSLEIGWWSGAN